MLSYFSNPQRFDGLARRVIPLLGVLTVVLLGTGLYLSFFGSPPDYQQGDTVRIMYVHVPAAYMAMALYAALAGRASSSSSGATRWPMRRPR